MPVEPYVEPDFGRAYQQLGRLLESPPDLSNKYACQQSTALLWLGRANALVGQFGLIMDMAKFPSAMDRLRLESSGESAVVEIFQILYRALGELESKAPAGMTGAFIPVGNLFDAYSALAKLFEAAKSDVMIVDPYMDQTVLTDFASAIPEGVKIRLLADSAYGKPGLEPAAKSWITQHGAARPLELRIAPARALHDRAIIVDTVQAWTLTQSLKDFAKRSPAEIVRVDSIADLKIGAYAEIWSNSTVVVSKA